MFKFRGVNIYPSSVDALLSTIPGLGSEYQVHLTRDEAGRDRMRLVVERAETVEEGRSTELEREVVHSLKTHLMVTADVEISAYASLPRTERKSKRIFDDRIADSVV
jgi:phenylacetate-coenzyme A ligase PaaK-like adenylate-forming protein